MKMIKCLAGLALAVFLTACGGGGGSPGVTVPGDTATTPVTTTTTVVTTTTAVVTPASVEVLASANEVLSAGAEVLITAVVKNVNNVGMADQTVTFAVNGGATLRAPTTTTNDDGVATARLSAGANKALRSVTVTVTSGSATGSITLPVSGTRITLTGPASLKLGDVSTYLARLVDSSGNGIGGASISILSDNGNGLSSSSVTTSPNGEASFIYTANKSGVDKITIAGLGATSQVLVGVSAIDFTVLAPESNKNVLVGASQSISVQYKDGVFGQAGETVLFSTTRGSLSAASAVTDVNGVATVTVSSNSSGPANVVAQIPGVGQITLPLQFVATTPASLVLQANPGAVLPNTGGSTTNQSTLEAVVLDASGNAVANRQVNFTILKDDGNNGQLSSPTAQTDINGRAQIQFIAGAQSTSSNGVLLQGEVVGTSVVGTTALTVNGRALFINIAFGNTISNLDETSYSKPFAIYVTDSNGNAVGNQRVTISAVPRTYSKGYMSWDEGASIYRKSASLDCPNEDSDRNGSLGLTEDTNTDGFLTPGNKAVPTPGSVLTDSQGRATFNLQYGEQYAYWIVVDLVARASVQGTESSAYLRYELDGLSSDYTNRAVAPAGWKSPFGGGLDGNGNPIPLSCLSPE